MNCGQVQGVLPSLMKVTYWGTPFPRALAHCATHAHQLKESQAKTLPMAIIAMRQKNVNRVNTTIQRVENSIRRVDIKRSSTCRGALNNPIYVDAGLLHRPFQNILSADLLIPEVVHTLDIPLDVILLPPVLLTQHQHHRRIAS